MLEIVSTPPVERHVWCENGTALSLVGRLPVLTHQATGSNITMTPEGTRLFGENPEFSDFLGKWATTVASGKAFNRFSQHRPVPGLALDYLQTSGNTYQGGFAETSIYAPAEELDGLLFKAFDYNPRHGRRQFDTMSLIEQKIEAATPDVGVKTPINYAIMYARRRPKTTLFMQRLDGKTARVNPYWSPGELTKEADEILETKLDELTLSLKNLLGPLGFLANDLAPRNWYYGKPRGSVQDPSWYIIDQPLGKRIELSKFALPLGRMLAAVSGSESR